MIDFEEIDFRQTRIGEISLRRRTQLTLGIEIYEVKLGDNNQGQTTIPYDFAFQ